jgi:hypothetical protein
VTSSLPSVSRLPGKCGILDVSELYRSPRPVTGIALHFPSCVLKYRIDRGKESGRERNSETQLIETKRKTGLSEM